MTGASGKVSLRLAMSLDGFIADDEGGYGWIHTGPSTGLDTEHQVPFRDYLDTMDLVVMGRHCFDQGEHVDFVGLDLPVLVAASQPPKTSIAGVAFTTDVLSSVNAARGSGSHCFLFGGGELVTTFLRANLIDELMVGIVPIILGQGRRLFGQTGRRIDLRLIDVTVRDSRAGLTFQPQ